MANYSKFLSLINGVARTVDLSNSANVLELGGNLQMDGSSAHIILSAQNVTTSYQLNWPAAQAASSGYVLANDGSGNLSWVSASAGSVTSVGLVLPSSVFNVTVSPITSSGNLTAVFQTQSANTVFAGPSSGSAAAPTFRGLVSADIPNNAANTTGTASNITASSNSTLTTLSALSLPTSQLSGSISAAQMLALPTNDIYVGNGSNQPAAVAMSGDASIASSGALTLATVNSNVGSFGSSTSIPSFTVNAKGLITAASGNAVIAPAGTLSGTTLASNVVSSSLTSLGTQAQALNMGGFQINDLASPSVSSDAATKGYVDAAINGLYWQPPVEAFAASNVPLTGSTPLVIDGYTVQNGDRLILNDQTTSSQNGTYTAAVSGGSYTLTATSVVPAVGYAYLVLDGTVYADTGWVVTSTGPDVFVQFSSAGKYTFNSPLSLSGTSVSLNYGNGLTVSSGNLIANLYSSGALAFNGAAIAVQVDNSTIDINGSNQLEVKAGGISNSQISSSAAIAFSKLAALPTAEILVGNGSNVATAVAASGDLSLASSGAFTIEAIQGNSVSGTTGTGNVVFSASPTFTGTIAGAAMTLSSTLVATGAISGSNLTAGGHASLDLLASNNLSDVANPETAFDNISPMTTKGDLIYENATPAAARLAIGSTGQILTVSAGGLPVWAAPATDGTVTSVAFADDSTTPIYAVSGSPVTSSGTLAITLNTQSANKVFAGPASGSAAQPSFRSLVSQDIPTDNVTIDQNGAGNTIEVISSPAVIRNVIAGQTFSANTTYALRWGNPNQSETAGRVYAADMSTSTWDKFHVIGLFNSASSVAIAGSISMVVSGPLALRSGDTNFASTDQGLPVWLGSAGAYLGNAAGESPAAGNASVKLGMAEAASTIWVEIQIMGVN